MDKNKWDKSILPEYEQAFKALKTINKDLVVESQPCQLYMTDKKSEFLDLSFSKANKLIFPPS